MRASLIMPNFLRVVDTILLLLLLFAVITILNTTLLLSVQVLICGRGRGSIQLNLNRLINRTINVGHPVVLRALLKILS